LSEVVKGVNVEVTVLPDRVILKGNPLPERVIITEEADAKLVIDKMNHFLEVKNAKKC
jgi:hypothetical protein